MLHLKKATLNDCKIDIFPFTFNWRKRYRVNLVFPFQDVVYLIYDFLYVRINLNVFFYIFVFLFLSALSDTLCPLADYE